MLLLILMNEYLGADELNIYVKMKTVGKRKPVLDRVPYEIPENISNLEELLSVFVRIEVEKYNQKGTDMQIIPFLTEKEIREQASVGKVGFGRIYSEKKADEKQAFQNAIQCYEDGLVRVFLNDRELTDLKEPIQVKEEDCITFIRLTFLAGRLW